MHHAFELVLVCHGLSASELIIALCASSTTEVTSGCTQQPLVGPVLGDGLTQVGLLVALSVLNVAQGFLDLGDGLDLPFLGLDALRLDASVELFFGPLVKQFVKHGNLPVVLFNRHLVLLVLLTRIGQLLLKLISQRLQL